MNHDRETLNPAVWGPHYWHTLHTIAFQYPHFPNAATKRKFYDFVKSIPLFIPVKSMANDFNEMLDLYPVAPYLDTRDSFVRWMHFIHNKINEKLEKPRVSLHEFFQQYYHEYKEPKIKKLESTLYYRMYLHIAVFLVITSMIAYFYSQ